MSPFKYLLFLPLLVSCGGGGSSNAPTQGDLSTAARTSVINPGDVDCPYGGILVESGIDENANGILDDNEVDTSEKVCNGEPGINSLVTTTETAPNTSCPSGGLAINIGLDTNRNDILDPSEITNTTLLCNVQVIPNNLPIANAGVDQTVSHGATVVLDAVDSSDADGDTLTYAWTLSTIPVGSSATLASTNTQITGFVADLPGTYIASLIVNDGIGDSTADEVIITATNQTPVANAGTDQTTSVGIAANLDATNSTDGDGDTLTYSWSITTAPGGSTASIVGATDANPTFTPDQVGDYTISLVVNDGIVDSLADNVTITAIPLVLNIQAGGLSGSGGTMTGNYTLTGFINTGITEFESTDGTYTILSAGSSRKLIGD